MPTTPTGIPTTQPSSQPSSRPTTHLRTRIEFSLEQKIVGVSKASFDADSNAQYAFKVALTRVVEGLVVKDVTIDSTTGISRRLREEKEVLDDEMARRKLDAVGILIDYL